MVDKLFSSIRDKYDIYQGIYFYRGNPLTSSDIDISPYIDTLLNTLTSREDAAINKEFIKKIYLIFLGIEGDHLSVLLKTFLYTTVNRRLMRETVTGIDDVYDAYKKIYFIFEDEVKKRDEVSARHKQFVDNLDTAIETIKS